MIHDIVYKYLIKHKDYKKIKDLNIYEKLLEFSKNSKRDTGQMSYYTGNQDVYIEDFNFRNYDFLTKKDLKIDKNTIQGKNDYFLIDPKNII